MTAAFIALAFFFAGVVAGCCWEGCRSGGSVDWQAEARRQARRAADAGAATDARDDVTRLLNDLDHSARINTALLDRVRELGGDWREWERQARDDRRTA